MSVSNIRTRKFAKKFYSWASNTNLSVAELAWVLGVSATTVRNWLNGYCLPARDQAFKLMRLDGTFRVVFDDTAHVSKVTKRYADNFRKSA